MFQSEFTHIHNRCSLEVLIDHFSLTSPPLTAIAEIIHDIDAKSDTYGHPETRGIEVLFIGMTTTQHSNHTKLERGAVILDELYASFEANHKT